MIAFGHESSLLLSGLAGAPVPQVQLLSNGRYHVMLTSAGGGSSRWRDLAVTRWREDATCDPWGSFCYLRDLDSGHVWSTTLQPTLQRADSYEARFAAGIATFRRHDRGIETQADIAVSADDDVELRRVCITNGANARRVLDATSYAEVVLAPAATDAAHPVFNKLFVETEILPELQAILCTHRARAPDDPAPWMFHLAVAHEPAGSEPTFETDRMRFIGRGRGTARPQALDADACLSGSAGPVLDPVAAIRCRLTLDPGASAIIDWVTGIADTRDACMALIHKYRDSQAADHVLSAAPANGAAILQRLHVSEVEAGHYAHLARSVIYADASLRADPAVLALNRGGQSNLWAYGISGDLPIVLLRMADAANIELARQLIQAHSYWRTHGLAADLVIIAEEFGGQGEALGVKITTQVTVCGATDRIDRPGGIFVRSAEKMSEADRILLQTVARVVISDRDGSLPHQLEQRVARSPSTLPSDAQGRVVEATPQALIRHTATDPGSLLFDNGMGGFSADGCEYVITSAAGRMTPAPWVNVLANASFGTLVSESGSATSWSENAQAFRLTPWSNDPVGDPNTEAFYLRDEDSGHCWSPTLLPRSGVGPYITRHGFGYSVFEHQEDGLATELCLYVAIDAPVKFARLRLHNTSGRARRLSVTGYLEWVLGDEPAKTRMHVSTAIDPGSGALFASNPYNTEFAGRTAFFDVDEIAAASLCGDRADFLGRHGTLRDPAALAQPCLSGRVGGALDPCAAIRLPFELAEAQTREIVFRLGAAHSADEASQLVLRSRGATAAHDALAAVKRHWQHTLGAVQIETPDRALDIWVNGWLVYQILACRLWARTAFYQSSGAFGFRDQLQDVMALVHAAPGLGREHLLRCAARQFREGDVQHWWHPPSGRGVRTHCSDDFLWLPLATCRYVLATGDTGVLDEVVPFIEGNMPKAGDASCYEQPTVSADAASLYDHCVRAVGHGLRFGAHGLPLMGAGDWNDGMNLVGAGGRGESVWLGFFLYAVLTQFGALATRRGDAAFAQRCAAESARLRDAIECSAWDGDWYRRAWFDDGSPLGCAANTECRIDSIAQSWSVLSGAGEPQRARRAMDAVDRLLVKRESALVQLLAPPFDHAEPNPGYIKGYLRGVRENGGQYTHAAVWAAMAFAALGDAPRAWELCTLLNPIHHADSAQAIAVYKTEPYALASDVYSLAPHAGRGGWTWYTGAAGWMYRFIVESLLGLRLEGSTLQVVPCMPAHWPSFRVHYRYRETTYHITVLGDADAGAVPSHTIDGALLPGLVLMLVDDRHDHVVELRLPAAPDAPPVAS